MSLVIQRSLKILRRRSFQRYGVRRVQKEKAVYFQQRNFDEGAAEVKRLLQRDRKELTALENSLATEFAASNAGQKVQSDLEPDTDGAAVTYNQATNIGILMNENTIAYIQNITKHILK
eukprot:TRINITY_DN5590_c1_g3_i3.p3 TRINITY_DN5590_c1_g3~~TRINITY_DN5590_c1_g3_i3.p3  ORF type:complete len:119 (-),score=18.66 TRINITY_DN5590_c1_g3_i3:76-432(-)